MEKYNELLKFCKAGVFLFVNEYKNNYENISEAIDEILEEEELDENLVNDMLKTRTIIKLQFYPNTPGSFYVCYGASLENVLDRALAFIKKG